MTVEVKQKRNISIDRFRGIIVFLMILFQALEYFPALGILSQVAVHAPDTYIKFPQDLLEGFGGIFVLPNMTMADLIASAFMFTIGLTIMRSFRSKEEKNGKKKANLLMMQRYLLILGVGMTMTGFEEVLDFEIENWLEWLVVGTAAISIISGLIYLIFKFIVRKKEKVTNIIGKIVKYSVLVAGIIGLIMSIVNFGMYCSGIDENLGLWDVFQHIGVAGFVACLIMSFSKNNSTTYRLVTGLIVFAIFTIFHETTLPTISKELLAYNPINVLSPKTPLFLNKNMMIAGRTVDGGFIGGFGYASIILLSSVIADIYNKDVKKFRIITLLLAIPVVAVLIYVFNNFITWDPDATTKFTAGYTPYLSINKDSISPSYLLITFFTSSFMFMIVDFFKNFKFKDAIISLAGSILLAVLLLIFNNINLIGNDIFIPLMFFVGIFVFFVVSLIISKKINIDLFEIWGRNPLLLFILQFIFVNIILEMPLNDFAANANVLVSIVSGFILSGLITFISYYLYKKNKVLKI